MFECLGFFSFKILKIAQKEVIYLNMFPRSVTVSFLPTFEFCDPRRISWTDEARDFKLCMHIEDKGRWLHVDFLFTTCATVQVLQKLHFCSLLAGSSAVKIVPELSYKVSSGMLIFYSLRKLNLYSLIIVTCLCQTEWTRRSACRYITTAGIVNGKSRPRSATDDQRRPHKLTRAHSTNGCVLNWYDMPNWSDWSHRHKAIWSECLSSFLDEAMALVVCP